MRQRIAVNLARQEVKSPTDGHLLKEEIMTSEEKVSELLYNQMFIEVDQWGYTRYESQRRDQLVTLLTARYGGPENFHELNVVWSANPQSCSDAEYQEFLALCTKAEKIQEENKTGLYAEEEEEAEAEGGNS